MRFFADHCVSNAMINALRDAGNDVFRMREYLPVESADKTVMAKAQELDSILISLNGDFADIVSYPPGLYRGIVAIQLHNRPLLTDTTMRRLKEYLIAHPASDHYKGKLLLIEVDRIRIRT